MNVRKYCLFPFSGKIVNCSLDTLRVLRSGNYNPDPLFTELSITLSNDCIFNTVLWCVLDRGAKIWISAINTCGLKICDACLHNGDPIVGTTVLFYILNTKSIIILRVIRGTI